MCGAGLTRGKVPDDLANTQPTVSTLARHTPQANLLSQMGIDLEEVLLADGVALVREIGGDMTQIWPDYYETCSSVMVFSDRDVTWVVSVWSTVCYRYPRGWNSRTSNDHIARSVG